MPRYLVFNKPFQVLTQFTDPEGRQTLADYIEVPGVYSAGRLDYDSEGLLIVTDDGQLIHSMMHPSFKVPKTYLAQVEGEISTEAATRLSQGVALKDGPTLPAQVKVVEEPDWIWPRHPPIRERKNIPTSWIELTLVEGRNRQVRRMTAAVGHPTLRLIRSSIGDLKVEHVQPGTYFETNLETLEDNGIKKIKKAKMPNRSQKSHQRANRPLKTRRSRTK